MDQVKLEEMWSDLGDIPIDDNECIEETFDDFPVGTHREEIWHWFDEHYNGGVVKLFHVSL
ncbi:hypothetical protein [Enterococcus rivorum]|uniref:Uncharacterized protein n=1 Tax=Enterococcus rivorum TaxID=762845 RepID=A0A1E5L0C5_9ENTE|nr:hypothetical protein [Enterococcus rivorum]MBP2098836.1 hypothetical protein [Enterococcus rivorum]OEH83566.1 hypothetical protein BCR26_08790 [Enterococcus rivorum]